MAINRRRAIFSSVAALSAAIGIKVSEGSDVIDGSDEPFLVLVVRQGRLVVEAASPGYEHLLGREVNLRDVAGLTREMQEWQSCWAIWYRSDPSGRVTKWQVVVTEDGELL